MATDDTTASGQAAASRRGPRPNGGAGREHILRAAVEQFSEHGYQSTTIRGIAHAAGVDAKLIHYYFGTKEDLFSTAIADTVRSRGLPDILASPPQGGSPGIRHLTTVLNTLEDPTLGPAFIGLVRGVGTHEESRRIFLRFVREELLGRLAPQITGERAEEQVALAGTQILGLIMGRYVVKIPSLVSLSIEEAARVIGPTLDRYIAGDLGDQW